MGVGGTIFWVGVGGWKNILDGWEYVEVSGGWVGVGALFDNAQLKAPMTSLWMKYANKQNSCETVKQHI